MAKNSTNTASRASAANLAMEHAENNDDAKNTQQAKKATAEVISVPDHENDEVEQDKKAPLAALEEANKLQTASASSEVEESLGVLAEKQGEDRESEECVVEEESEEVSEVQHEEYEKTEKLQHEEGESRQYEEDEERTVAEEGQIGEPAAEASKQEAGSHEEEASKPEEVEKASSHETAVEISEPEKAVQAEGIEPAAEVGSEPEEVEEASSHAMVAEESEPEKAVQAEGIEPAAEVVNKPELLLKNVNANIEIPAISRDLMRMVENGRESRTNPSLPAPASNGTSKEAARLALDMGAWGAEQKRDLATGSAPADQQNGKSNKKLEDPFGVQELADVPLLSQPYDSLHLKASYPTTTAYRVAAIKKKRYMSLGNILFLIGSIIIVAGVLFVYFASLVSVGRPKVNGVPTVTSSTQNSQSADPEGILPPRFAGAETSAPPANGNVLAGYQWIHDGTKHALYVDANNHIQELYTANQQNWQITDLTRGAGAAVSNGHTLAGFEWQRGSSEQVVYVDAKGHVQQIFASMDDQWNVMDLTRKAQAPLANGRAISGYEWETTGSKQVVYIDQQNHIQELMSTDGDVWHTSDLTALTKAPLANGNVVVGYNWSRLGSKQVVYIDTTQHVQELSFTAGSWHRVDLHNLVGAPLAKGNVLVGYEWQQTGSKLIAYLSADNHIQLLSSGKVGNWSLVDLTQLVKAPATNGNVLVGYEWQQGGRNVLDFIDSGNHIQEVSEAPGEDWHLVDLNQFTLAAPPPNGKVLFGYDWAQHGTKQITYIDNRNNVQELTSSVLPNKWQLSNWKRK